MERAFERIAARVVLFQAGMDFCPLLSGMLSFQFKLDLIIVFSVEGYWIQLYNEPRGA